jgi:oligoribonuclease NrnB/cAMP/cGMP phosphodiesterase (DHH superfamily)
MQNLIIEEHTLPPSAFKFIVYHAHCIDGLTAAAIAWDWDKAFKRYEFIPMDAGHLPQAVKDMKEEFILFLDVAPNKAEYDELVSNGNRVLVIDHHKTALENLSDVEPEHKIMAMNASGAMLSFMYFYGHDAWAIKDAVDMHPDDRYKIMHDFVYMVQENDLFNFDKKPVLQIFDKPPYSSKQLFSGLCHYINHIKDSNLKIAMMLNFMFDFQPVLEKGKELVAEDDAYINGVIKEAKLIVTQNYRFMYATAESFKLCSQIGDRLLKDNSTAQFSMLIYPAISEAGEKLYRVSLRSLGHFDVEKFAKKFNGGGHPMASGFSTSDPDQLMNTILSEHQPNIAEV